MNFFRSQEQARATTFKLIALFALAVISLILLTNAAIVLLLFGSGEMSFIQQLQQAPGGMWVGTSTLVIGIIMIAMLFKYLSLRAGGKAVAEALGGTLIPQQTQDPKHKRLLNVVEEMAIASGISTPPVYLIHEPSINAFAAGFSPQDAVIGINQGTLDLLDRSELQGVIAHEFSHILNGDMRINLRLMAILHGILVIGIIGAHLLRGSSYRRSNERGSAAALALALVVIGYTGTFFGQLIKAAVSRQREFLADAAAVQYTRSTNGIAGALKKIAGHQSGSTMEQPSAEENSHLFFGSFKQFALGAMATHPPLDKRIKALDPSWDGQVLNRGAGHTGESMAFGLAGHQAPPQDSPMAGDINHHQFQALYGSVNLSAATSQLAHTSESLRDAAHDTFEARALVYAMLCSQEPEQQALQRQMIEDHAEPGVPEHVGRLLQEISQKSLREQLLLLQTAMPTLKQMSNRQYHRFYDLCAQVIVADEHIELHEWVIHRILTQELYGHFVRPHRASGRVKSLGKVEKEAGIVLVILANQAGTQQPETRREAFQRGAEILGLKAVDMPDVDFDYRAMNHALERLREMTPALMATFLEACAAVATADDRLTEEEFMLIKGVSATLGCPLPPALPDETNAP